jgi:REP element-mobilizing transposase RayT
MNEINLRKSHMDIGKLYFWTATINNWYKLLEEDELKEIVISSLQYLVRNNKIEVYAFVVMPNHLHLIWQLMDMNGKEQPHASFLKYTAHTFEKYLQLQMPGLLKLYKADAANKQYEFWQRDSLAFELLKKQTINQKIDYIHYNPAMERWKLCKEPSDYHYSSACFYETGIDNFKFVKHIGTIL